MPNPEGHSYYNYPSHSGIINLGSTCYLNAKVQIFTSLPSFVLEVQPGVNTLCPVFKLLSMSVQDCQKPSKSVDLSPLVNVLLKHL